MKQVLLSRTLQAMLPMVLGAIGGFAAISFPAYFQAFCSGSVL